MFYFFYQFCTKNEKYLTASLFCLAIAIQFQILNVIFTLPLIILYFILGRTKIGVKNILFSFVAFLLPLASFILFDYRHKFLMFNSFVKNYFVSSGDGHHFGFNFLNYVERLATEFSNIFFPSSKLLSLIILLATAGAFIVKIINDRKNKRWKFLAVWIFSTILIFLINSRMSQSNAAFIGVSGGLIILFSYLMEKQFSDKKSLLLVFFLIPILFSNLFAVDHFLTNPGKRLFDFFQGQFYKTDMAAVKYIYEESKNNSFKVDTVTSPLLISPLWDYLLGWYSQKNNLPPPKRTDEKIQFLIIEPYVDDFYKKQAMQKKSAIAKNTDSQYFGNIVVQKWIMD